MNMSVFRNFIMLLSFLFVLFSCGSNKEKIDLSGIDTNIKIERFEQEMFEMDQDTLPAAISYFYSNYDDFFEIFTYHIINIGSPSSRDFPGFFSAFLTDPLNREVYQATQEKFSDISPVEEDLNIAFKRVLYYFPETQVPRVISYISRFNNPYFSVGHYLGIGLDQYLGRESDYYTQLGIPEYQSRWKIPEKIVPDAIQTWINGLYPISDSANNVLAHIIHEGKLLYMLSKILPDYPIELSAGFTEDQLRWCKNNERSMWVTLIENKMLFSGNMIDIRKLTDPAPFTSVFTIESPGRAVVWTGWKIVGNYMKNNKNVSLPELMEDHNYQKILERSKYNP